jgi:quercetin dioxygenase-like cupin family protein
MLATAFFLAGALFAQDAQVTPLMSKDLADFPGKEGLMITVVYPPGASDAIHRRNAHAFVSVLEGTVVMQVKGGKEVTLTSGQTFYGPNDIHIVGRNASTTKPQVLGVFGEEQGRPGADTSQVTATTLATGDPGLTATQLDQSQR